MTERPARASLIFERILPWLLLILLGIFTYAYFTQVPYPGFQMTSGGVYEIFVDPTNAALQVGDQVIQVGEIAMETFLSDLRLTVFDGAQPGQHIPLVVERGGQTLTIDWVYPGLNQTGLLQRLNSQWWLPYIFWMAGTAALFFIRPKDTRRKLLIAFNFLTAIWLVMGSGVSKWHLWGSAIVLRMAIWLSIPIYLHFHWNFPRPLKRLPGAIWGVLYAIGGVLALAQWFELLPASSYFIGFLIALVGSILILAARAIFQKEDRQDIGWLVLVTSLILIPIIGSLGQYALGITPSAFVQGGSFLALPALPGAYFFVAYRRQIPSHRGTRRLFLIYLTIILLGTLTIIGLSVLDFQGNFFASTFGIGTAMIVLGAFISIVSFTPFVALPALAQNQIQRPHPSEDFEIRANRLLSLLLAFVIIAITFGLIILALTPWLNFTGAPAIVGILAAVTSGLLAITAYPSLQHFVDHTILGMPLPPTLLGEIYAERITTSLNQESLARLIRDDLLPSLLVRQAALLHIENKSLEPIFLKNVEDAQLPEDTDLSKLIDEAEIYRSPGDEDPFPWIRLILPLTIEGQLRGLWLLGRRDPDDYYAPSEITVLQTIANQTDVALVNIEQADRLRALHQANIERHEDERASLARDLHDVVLNQLASLSTGANEQIPPQTLEQYHSLTTQVRGIVSSLRPAMLNFGLAPGLEEMGEDLSDRAGDVDIQVDISPSDGRYDPMLKAHLYRIMQQATENALRHAQASTLRIHGSCGSEGVHLIVEDDGIGFDSAVEFDQLLADKHFGLAGMHERAEIIGGDLRVMSTPGQGTKIIIDWTPSSF